MTRSQWRPGPLRFAILLGGLWVFGTGEACIVAAGLGNSPWTVLAQGLSVQTPIGIGFATVLISAAVLCAWFPLRQRPGLGTIMNAMVVGIGLGVMVGVLPDDPAAGLSWLLLGTGIAFVALGGGVYLGTQLGPGPRDGLMTGLHARTGKSLRLVRTGIELSALIAGFALGGTVGIGTAAFALLIGPGVQFTFERAQPVMRNLR